MVDIDTTHGTARLENTLPNRGKPILFVHGFNSSSEIWLDGDETNLGNEDEIGFVSIASEQDYDSWILDLSDPITGDIRKLATEDLHQAIQFIWKQKKKKIRLVCHSMGGLLARIVTTENLVPEIPAFLSSPHLDEVVLLATPNHGYSPGGILSRIDSEWVRVAERALESLGWESLLHTTERPFFQMLKGTDLLTRLNNNPPLCPQLSWRNGVALEDLVVPPESAMFGLTEIQSIPRFEQQLFHAGHMEGRTQWQTMPKDLREWLKRNLGFKLEYLEYPPIYRSREVAKWIFAES